MKKATKLELLEFFKDRDFVSAFDLIERFDYTPGGARAMLHWLKSQKLIAIDSRGVYTITDEGLRRFFYYGRAG